MTTSIKSITCCFVLIWLPFIRVSYAVNEKTILKHLLGKVSPETRPVQNISRPVIVTVGIELIQVVAINERSQYITNKIWMRLSWTNELMKWDPKNWGNIGVVKISPQSVWKPDIYLYDNVAEDLSEGTERYKAPVIMASNGKHSWFTPILFTSSCIIDVKNFPFDYQTCSLKFGSWTSTGGEIDLRKDALPVVTSNYINSSEWVLLGVDKEIHRVLYQCCPDPYVDIEFTLQLKRKPSYYVFNVIVPCVLLMVIILFSFFIPPATGERIGVLITVMLVFAVFLQLLSDALPINSNSTPLISVFYITVMSESACSLIATCFILAINYRSMDKGVTQLPNWVRVYLLPVAAKYIGVRYSSENKSVHGLSVSHYGNGSDNNIYDSRIPAKSGESVTKCRYTDDNNVEESGELLKLQDTNDSPLKSVPFNDLLQEMNTITSNILTRQRNDEIRRDWQLFSKILDAIFFFIFLFTFGITSAVILLPVYITNK